MHGWQLLTTHSPGKICTPPQENCNFERSPPSDEYVCRPEECKPVPEIPDYVNLTWPTPTDADCAWRGPALGFFNLDPTDFDLSYAIFDVFGQPVCEAPSPVWGDSQWHDSNPPRKLGKTRRAKRTNNPLARMWRRQVATGPVECYGVYDSANGKHSSYCVCEQTLTLTKVSDSPRREDLQPR